MVFVFLAVVIQVSLLLDSLSESGLIVGDYYKFGSLVSVETEIGLTNSVNMQYLNFTSGVDNVFVNYTNGVYTIISGGAEYIILAR